MPDLTLSYEEAETVAAEMHARWNGLTGQSVAPSVEAIADLVQRVLRRAREITEGREG